MSYTKQEFKSGEKLYAAQLNAMDEQIAANAAKGEELSGKIKENAEKSASEIAKTAMTGEVDTIGEFVFSFPLTDAVYMSDHTMIGDKLYVINASNDAHTDYKDVTVYSVDPVAKTATYEKTIKHNLGHANTIDYCAGNDCLIMGNGSSDETLPGKIFILPDVSTRETWEFSDCIVIDVGELIEDEEIYIAPAGLDTSNGSLINPYTAGNGVLGYVTITDSTITCSRKMYKICFYDDVKNFIATIRADATGGDGFSYTVPAGAVYARIMFVGLTSGTEVENMKRCTFTGVEIPREAVYYENWGLDTSNGSDFEYSGFWVLGYVGITGEKIVCSSPMYKVCFYDSSFDFVQTIRGGNDVYEITVPDGAVYARMQMSNTVVPFENATTLTWQGIELSAEKPPEFQWGIKVQAVWGEHNNELYNIAYVVSNNNRNIRKILLGKTDGNFDGTYILLKEWSAKTGFDVNQGTVYRDGKIYAAIGHSQLWMTENTLNSDGTITQRQRKDVFVDETGTVLTSPFSEGITIHDGYLYLGGWNQRMYVYRHRR